MKRRKLDVAKSNQAIFLLLDFIFPGPDVVAWCKKCHDHSKDEVIVIDHSDNKITERY